MNYTHRFGGSVGHDPHILYTLSALQILALCNKIDLIDGELVANYIASLQQSDGSFYGDKWGEVDTRFSYCAVNSLALLKRLNSGCINISTAVEFINRFTLLLISGFFRFIFMIVNSCKNFDGGYGAVPG